MNVNDLFVVVMNDLKVFHVKYYPPLDAFVLWLHPIAKYVIKCSCKLQEIG
jgi:hypothetical protein